MPLVSAPALVSSQPLMALFVACHLELGVSDGFGTPGVVVCRSEGPLGRRTGVATPAVPAVDIGDASRDGCTSGAAVLPAATTAATPGPSR